MWKFPVIVKSIFKDKKVLQEKVRRIKVNTTVKEVCCPCKDNDMKECLNIENGKYPLGVGCPIQQTNKREET